MKSVAITLEIMKKLVPLSPEKRAQVLTDLRGEFARRPLRFARSGKKLAELTGRDIPPGLDAEDVASDCAPEGEDAAIAIGEIRDILSEISLEILNGADSALANIAKKLK